MSNRVWFWRRNTQARDLAPEDLESIRKLALACQDQYLGVSSIYEQLGYRL